MPEGRTVRSFAFMTLLHIVGHDGSDHGDDALALARTIGAGRDVSRLVVHVLTRPGHTELAGDIFIDELETDERALFKRVRSCRRADEGFEVVIARTAAHGLQDHAAERDADLVVVGAGHDALGPGRTVISSVAAGLLSGGPCAVALAPAGYAARARTLSRITVGVDGSSAAWDALNEAAALAAHAGALVDVVCASSPAVPPREANRVAEHTANEALEAIPGSVRGIAGGGVGSAGVVIEEFAARQDADLIITGSRGNGALRRVLLGSTGRHIVQHATRPVLVLPRGTRATLPTVGGNFAVAP